MHEVCGGFKEVSGGFEKENGLFLQKIQPNPQGAMEGDDILRAKVPFSFLTDLSLTPAF